MIHRPIAVSNRMPPIFIISIFPPVYRSRRSGPESIESRSSTAVRRGKRPDRCAREPTSRVAHLVAGLDALDKGEYESRAPPCRLVTARCFLINFAPSQAGLHNTDRVFVAILLPVRLEPLHKRCTVTSEPSLWATTPDIKKGGQSWRGKLAGCGQKSGKLSLRDSVASRQLSGMSRIFLQAGHASQRPDWLAALPGYGRRRRPWGMIMTIR